MKYIIIYCCLFSFANAFAQQDTLHQISNTYFGFGFSLGGGNVDGLYGDVSFYLQKKNNYISLKTAAIEEIHIFTKSPNSSISDVSLLVGKSYTFNRYHYIRFGAGISFVNQINQGKFLYDNCDRPGGCLFSSYVYETVRKKSAGLPLEVTYNIFLDRTAAATLGFSANLNHTQSFCGVSIGLVLGRLRDKVQRK